MWSEDNRTAGFRLCGEGTKGIRMECRIGGADLNPYLAFAALIAAGLAGIDEKLSLQEPFVGDAYQAARLPEIPKTLRDATESLAKSKMLTTAIALTTAIRTPGRRGKRLSARIKANVPAPTSRVTQLLSPAKTPCTKATASASRPLASTEKPNSFGN